MEWTDEGIVLGIRRHGEANAILELMTPEHGRHLGLVRGGGGSRLRPVLQPGNSLRAIWRARLDEHLGHFTVEGLDLRAASFLHVAYAVYGVTHLAALCRLLPERDPHRTVYEDLAAILGHIDEPIVFAMLVVRFELDLLAELGFGLDLTQCAATGAVEDLVYVSPKSGRAVSRAAGAPWHGRLLDLPAFLSTEADTPPSAEELGAGFRLTGYFLTHYALEPRGLVLSEARQQFLTAVVRALPSVAGRM
ncbi:MAG TPA: DNA repair protein RecO [Xanthobacteraceae bacterium]|jgi:DNA repair protein RecO (recombination protein O)|nr:DNA repair protein RecO [Xanthobacteraceae bacterium]